MHDRMEACCQKRGVPEEAKIGRTSTRFVFRAGGMGAPMTDSPRDAVSAAEPLCTHGKDIPGLGPPNSLKLLVVYYYLVTTATATATATAAAAAAAATTNTTLT